MPDWTTMTNLAAGDDVLEADMDAIRGNIEYLLEPNQDDAASSGANYTVTSTSWAKLDATLDLTIETHGGPVLIVATLTVSHASSSLAYFDLAIDGTRIGDPTVGLQAQGIDAANTISVIGIPKPAAGSHTISLYVKVGAGTLTVFNTTSGYPAVHLWAIEL